VGKPPPSQDQVDALPAHSHPARSLAIHVAPGGREVRLVTANTPAYQPDAVLVRMGKSTVGLTLMLKEPPGPHILSLGLLCAETRLPEPIQDRAVEDQGTGGGTRDPYMVQGAQHVAKHGECARVPALER
jgi:hypothetical protein